nr:MAG TPA: hypothetical protein [Caudoviricetes sp.]
MLHYHHKTSVLCFQPLTFHKMPPFNFSASILIKSTLLYTFCGIIRICVFWGMRLSRCRLSPPPRDSVPSLPRGFGLQAIGSRLCLKPTPFAMYL